MSKEKNARLREDAYEKPPAPAEPQGDAGLIELVKLGTTRFSRDRGMPDPSPAFPYEVAFAMGSWEQFILGIKRMLTAAEQRATRAALDKLAAFRLRAAKILCETRGHNGHRPCDFCLNVTLFEPDAHPTVTPPSEGWEINIDGPGYIDKTQPRLAASPIETKMLAELKRLLSNRELVLKAPTRQWHAEWAAITDALADWEPTTAAPPPLAAFRALAESFPHEYCVTCGRDYSNPSGLSCCKNNPPCRRCALTALIAEAEKGKG